MGKTDKQIIESSSRPLGDIKELAQALYKKYGEDVAPVLEKYGLLSKK